MFKVYYQLTKPGIIYGNLLTAAAGYLLASKWQIEWRAFLGLLAGISLVIASACVFNNYLDRGLDEKMQRTRRRALVTGQIAGPQALIYAAFLGVIGFALLIGYTNGLTVAIGAGAFVDYIVLYGVAKRRSVYGTLVGSISGAAPVVAGYCTFTDRFDGGAVILFLILVFWQMPHFYAIALYRLKDYKAAGLPVWPVARGARSAKVQILLYVAGFIIVNLALSVFGYAGVVYAVVMTLLGGYWLWRGLKGFQADSDRRWGRSMFLQSLTIILGLSIMLALGPLLP
ncbi:MAG TPA: heme o synthase [Candidatus Saccharimonadales bacterium]